MIVSGNSINTFIIRGNFEEIKRRVEEYRKSRPARVSRRGGLDNEVCHMFSPADNLAIQRSLEERGLVPSIGSSMDSFIEIQPNPEKGQVGVAGFDLRVGQHIGRSEVLGEIVTEHELGGMDYKQLEEGESMILQPDKDGSNIYYITSFEQVNISPDLEMFVDSKSTTGRVGCMSHNVGRTSKGHMITAVQPFAFPIKITCGKTRLSQVVVRYKNTPYMTSEEVRASNELGFEGEGVNIDWDCTARGLQMRFDTLLAYKAKMASDKEPIDMDAKGTMDWKDYFEAIEGNSEIVCDKKTLYLLGSQGTIDLKAICGLLSREQEVMTGTGAWGHFAGVFQPFFRGGITMEFYSHSKIKIRRGDKAGIVIFDRLEGLPESKRPKDYGGSYQDQKPPRLPKMFKQ